MRFFFKGKALWSLCLDSNSMIVLKKLKYQHKEVRIGRDKTKNSD